MAKSSLLIVEDNPDMLDLMRLILECTDFDVLTADDGAQAVMVLDQFRPDAIITDLMMPNVTGVELIEFVRGSKQLSDIPIVAISANNSGPLKKAQEVGANAILKKPLNYDALLETINQIVPSH
ncbi:MAG TPA: response regulator [Blastocatellia bacterium]|nr:response regulator [Blastocatellia bacterium]